MSLARKCSCSYVPALDFGSTVAHSSAEKTYLKIGVMAIAFGALGGAFASVCICVLVGFVRSGRGSEAGILSEVGHGLVVSGISTRRLHDQIVDGVSNDRVQVEIVSSASRDGYSVCFVSRWIHGHKLALLQAHM